MVSQTNNDTNRGRGRGRDRRRNDEEKNPYIEKVVSVRRVSKVVKGGRNLSFAAFFAAESYSACLSISKCLAVPPCCFGFLGFLPRRLFFFEPPPAMLSSGSPRSIDKPVILSSTNQR